MCEEFNIRRSYLANQSSVQLSPKNRKPEIVTRLVWQNTPNAIICTMCSRLTVFIVSSTDFLETYKIGLVNVVNAKQSIIAQEILNGYLSRNAAAATKREWCEVATDASSYSENKKLEREVKEELPPT